jgi:hypothetical protein
LGEENLLGRFSLMLSANANLKGDKVDIREVDMNKAGFIILLHLNSLGCNWNFDAIIQEMNENAENNTKK